MGYEDLDFSNYEKKIKEINKKFDLIIIDRRARSSCLKECLKHLKKNGIVIFDNSFRKKRYQQV